MAKLDLSIYALLALLLCVAIPSTASEAPVNVSLGFQDHPVQNDPINYKTVLPLITAQVRGLKSPEPYKGQPLYEKSWAVVIGINDYDEWPSLQYAVNDAVSVRKKLREHGFEVIYLTDKQATRENILYVLGDELPRKVDAEDRVLIFFAGHGQTEELYGRQMGYIIPVDGDVRNYYSTAISMRTIRELSDRIPAKHIYYVMDSCYSGLLLSRSGGLPYYEEGYVRKLTSLPVRQMITAGGKGEQAVEYGGHGLFTLKFLAALDGAADMDGDGFLTASEIGGYVRKQVSIQSENRQTPQYGTMYGEGEFIIVTGKPSPIAVAPEAVASLEKERVRIEQERRKLKEEKRRLEEQKKLIEEQRKLADERKWLEELQKNLEGERKKSQELPRRLGEEKEHIASLKKTGEKKEINYPKARITEKEFTWIDYTNR